MAKRRATPENVDLVCCSCCLYVKHSWSAKKHARTLNVSGGGSLASILHKSLSLHPKYSLFKTELKSQDYGNGDQLLCNVIKTFLRKMMTLQNV